MNINIQLPSSKSISNRALIMQAIEPKIVLENLSKANDTKVLQQCLKANEAELHVADAGTAARFLLAYKALLNNNNTYKITSLPSLQKRPMAPLVNALLQLGANIIYEEHEGYLPITIKPAKIIKNKVEISGEISSQFISALCMVAPALPNGLQIVLQGQMVSESYIKLTLQTMAHFGIKYTYQNQIITIAHQPYVPKRLEIESDWSSATFIFMACALMPYTKICIQNIKATSTQGDAAIIDFAKYMGVQTTEMHLDITLSNNLPIYSEAKVFDFINHPDLAIPYLVSCALKFRQFSCVGLGNLVYKESNRILALQNELIKIGIQLIENNGLITFVEMPNFDQQYPIIFETYDDHRIAMALSLVAIIHPQVIIKNPSVVAKSFPDFWEQISKLGIQLGFAE